MPERDSSFAELFSPSDVGIGGKYDNGKQTDKPAAATATATTARAESNPEAAYMSVYLANGIDRRVLKRIRKGKPEDSIDLHGMTSAEAIETLQEFVGGAQQRGLLDIEIIHGKGAHSPSAVLRPAARRWLAECAEVLAFTEVNNNTGAVRALLRRPKR